MYMYSENHVIMILMLGFSNHTLSSAAKLYSMFELHHVKSSMESPHSSHSGTHDAMRGVFVWDFIFYIN